VAQRRDGTGRDNKGQRDNATTNLVVVVVVVVVVAVAVVIVIVVIVNGVVVFVVTIKKEWQGTCGMCLCLNAFVCLCFFFRTQQNLCQGNILCLKVFMPLCCVFLILGMLHYYYYL